MTNNPIPQIQKERQQCFGWKNIAPIKKALDEFCHTEALDPDNYTIAIDDAIRVIAKKDKKIFSHYSSEDFYQLLMLLKSWRKGPFEIAGHFIDTEWRSDIKYNIIKPHLNIEKKIFMDIGCNNGYYLFRALEKKPKKLIGFDPSPICKMQFDLLNHFLKTDITYELLGIEHIIDYVNYTHISPDVIICLGVLYHRSDPVKSLRLLYDALKKNGELIIDSFIIDGDEPIALFPKDRYSKIPNTYFIPTITTLKNWLYRAKFKEVELITTLQTTTQEQRQTKWINAQSLEDFIDSTNGLTVEGYPAPKRAYLIAKK